MPFAPGRQCRVHTCRNVTTNADGFCNEHRRVYAVVEDSPYNDQRWREVRASYLRRHPLCEDCEMIARVTVAQMVHHKVAIVDGGRLLDDENLRSLCWICHGKYAPVKEK